MPRAHAIPAVRIAGAALGLALALPGCPAQDRPGPEAGSAAPTTERARVLGPFLARHWVLPLAPQGEPPSGFTREEGSLDPAICGACHPKQYEEWQTSLHAAAFSPGFSGQLIEGALAKPAEIRGCQSCHAPLGEQQPFDASLAPEPSFDPALRPRGLVCAGCHVRAHRVYGPPRRPELPPVDGPVPHGGFEARPEYQESRFCGACHQFLDDPGVNGKPVENTWREWRASPFAADGRTCQSCHMPDRAHLWRGIHDAEMVRAAVDVDLVPLDLAGHRLSASLVLASRDVGHAFPTYVTPRVFLAIWQEDDAGHELEGTRLEATIGREIDFGALPPRERFDTRVGPGESVKLAYAAERESAAAVLVGRVTVDPDFHYRGLFASLLPTLRNPEAHARIEEAQRRTVEAVYTLAEVRRPLPPPTR